MCLQESSIILKFDDSCISYLMRSHEQLNVEQLMKSNLNIQNKRIHPLENGDGWKMAQIEELTVIKLGFLDIDMDEKDINGMLQDLSVTC